MKRAKMVRIDLVCNVSKDEDRSLTLHTLVALFHAERETPWSWDHSMTFFVLSLSAFLRPIIVEPF